MDEKDFKSSWHESSVAVKPTHPQLMLYKAVFVSGVRDYVAPADGGKQRWAEAWIFDGDSTEHDAGSFPWYCRRLNLNPDKTRERIRLVSDLKRIIDAGSVVEEAVVRFLKHGGLPLPEPKPKKHETQERLPIYEEGEIP